MWCVERALCVLLANACSPSPRDDDKLVLPPLLLTHTATSRLPGLTLPLSPPPLSEQLPICLASLLFFPPPPSFRATSRLPGLTPPARRTSTSRQCPRCRWGGLFSGGGGRSSYGQDQIISQSTDFLSLAPSLLRLSSLPAPPLIPPPPSSRSCPCIVMESRRRSLRSGPTRRCWFRSTAGCWTHSGCLRRPYRCVGGQWGG